MFIRASVYLLWRGCPARKNSPPEGRLLLAPSGIQPFRADCEADPIDAYAPTNYQGFSFPARKNSPPEGRLLLDVPEGIRTPDRALRRRMLYPAELPGHIRINDMY